MHMDVASAMVEGAELTLRRPVSSLRPVPTKNSVATVIIEVSGIGH